MGLKTNLPMSLLDLIHQRVGVGELNRQQLEWIPQKGAEWQGAKSIMKLTNMLCECHELVVRILLWIICWENYLAGYICPEIHWQGQSGINLLHQITKLFTAFQLSRETTTNITKWLCDECPSTLKDWEWGIQ